jgi:hypothetical protein
MQGRCHRPVAPGQASGSLLRSLPLAQPADLCSLETDVATKFMSQPKCVPHCPKSANQRKAPWSDA